jgi:hypothetical protein
MSKNLTRKSLAFGALIALGSSVFAGAPAFAGVESAKVTLVPSAGSTYTTLIGASFEFANEVDATIENDGLENKDVEDLTYVIGNASAQTLKFDLDNANASATSGYGGNIKGTSGDTSDVGTYETAAGTYTSAKKFISVTAANLESADTADVGKNFLKITSSNDSTDAFSITVQAFLDDNNNGEIDTFEATSAVRTLNFIKASAATVSTAVTSAVVGSSTLLGTVTIGNDVNMKNLVTVSGAAATATGSQVKIKFLKNGTVRKMQNSSTVSYDTVDVAYDSTNSYLTNSGQSTVASVDATDTSTVAAGTYTAKAYLLLADATLVLLGAESSGVSASNGTNASADNTDYLVATANSNVIRVDGDSTTVRTGTTSAVVFSSRVLETNNTTNSDPWATGNGTLVKTAGLKVKVTLSKGATFTAGHEVTAGGKTLTSTSGAVSYETTTDKDGKVSVSAVSNKGTKGDVYRVLVQVLTTSGWETGDYTDVTFADATISSITALDKVGSDAKLQIAKGGTLPLAYEVRDNFGSLSAVAGTYRVNIATNGTSNSGNVALSGGKATFNLVDETIASTGNYTITAKVQKLNTAGDAYDDVSGINTAVVVYVGTSAAAAVTVPADATTGIALEDSDFVSHDLRLDASTTTFVRTGLSSSVYFTVNGVVTSANGAVVPGAAVTVSAKGLQFAAGTSDAASLLAKDSITVRADAAGAYSVKAYSHTAGDVKIAVVSGAAKNTVTAKWLNPTAADDDSIITITGASSVKAGRSSTHVVALTDKWGNAIKSAVTVKVEQAGAGYLNTIPTAVSAVDGKTTLTLIAQPADAGLTTLTVTYDSDTDVVAKKEILVGISASISKAATTSVRVKNANGLVVKVVRGTKSATKTATSDSYKVSLKGGNGTVSVYVNGVKVASK